MTLLFFFVLFLLGVVLIRVYLRALSCSGSASRNPHFRDLLSRRSFLQLRRGRYTSLSMCICRLFFGRQGKRHSTKAPHLALPDDEARGGGKGTQRASCDRRSLPLHSNRLRERSRQFLINESLPH